MILAKAMQCVQLITIHSFRENHGIKITIWIFADNDVCLLFITTYFCFIWYRRILATTMYYVFGSFLTFNISYGHIFPKDDLLTDNYKQL